jgi:hypothetical protein
VQIHKCRFTKIHLNTKQHCFASKYTHITCIYTLNKWWSPSHSTYSQTKHVCKCRFISADSHKIHPNTQQHCFASKYTHITWEILYLHTKQVMISKPFDIQWNSPISHFQTCAWVQIHKKNTHQYKTTLLGQSHSIWMMQRIVIGVNHVYNGFTVLDTKECSFWVCPFEATSAQALPLQFPFATVRQAKGLPLSS